MNKNVFYIYRYIRLDTHTPFYVGKGMGQRASMVHKHNNICKRIVKKHGFIIEYIIENLEEKQAFDKEIEFISIYKKIGYCEANLTNGGQGLSGIVRSEETKRKISNSHFGMKHSLESKKKMSYAKIGNIPWNKGTNLSIEKKDKIAIKNGSMPFLCFDINGNFIGEWVNQTECANILNLNRRHIYSCLKGQRKFHKGYSFKYKEFI